MSVRDVVLNLMIKAPNAEARDALAAIGKEADRQAANIVKMNAALNPALIRERVKLTFDEEKAKKALNVAMSAETRRQTTPDVIRERVKQTLEEEKAQKALNRAMNEETRRQTTPDVIRERVKQTLEQEKAQKSLNKAVNEERSRQLNRQQSGALMGGFRNLLGIKPKDDAGGAQGGGGMSALAALGPAAIGAAAGLFALKSVALASPGAMDRFRIIVEDTTAVVGQALLPVLEIVGQVVKLFGDVLLSILPSTGEMREALKPVTAFLLDLRDALGAIAPFIKDNLLVALKALGIAIQALLLPFKVLAQWITDAFGSGKGKLKDSTGTAARNISFTSQDAAAKSIYQAAFKSGTAPQGEYHGKLDAMLKALEDISKWVANIGDKLGAANPFKIKQNLDEARDWKKKEKEIIEIGLPGLRDRGLRETTERINKSGGKIGQADYDDMLTQLKILFKNAGGTGDQARDWLDQAVRRAIDGGAGGK